MILYITTSGTKLSKESGMIIISDSKGVVSKLPKEQIESISVFGDIQITSDVIKHCLNELNKVYNYGIENNNAYTEVLIF